MTASDRSRPGTAPDRRRWDELLARLRPQLSAGAKLTGEESLATKTTMRVGGAARGYAEPASVADLQILLGEAKAHGVPVFMLGRGSNLIVPDSRRRRGRDSCRPATAACGPGRGCG